jgi:hypothetical protein
MDLKKLINVAATGAEKIFYKTGRVLPMWHAVKSNGQAIIIPSLSDDKDVAVALVKAFFELENVEAYVFISEAWVLSAPLNTDIAAINQHGLEHHPDRREVLMFAAEDRDGGEQTAYRYILRPEHSKAKLAPLVMDDMTHRTSSGRMVGLLRRKKPS